MDVQSLSISLYHIKQYQAELRMTSPQIFDTCQALRSLYPYRFEIPLILCEKQRPLPVNMTSIFIINAYSQCYRDQSEPSTS